MRYGALSGFNKVVTIRLLQPLNSGIYSNGKQNYFITQSKMLFPHVPTQCFFVELAIKKSCFAFLLSWQSRKAVFLFSFCRGGGQEKHDRWIQPIFVSGPCPSVCQLRICSSSHGYCVLRICSSSHGYCAALYESCFGAPCHVMYVCMSLVVCVWVLSGLVWFACCCLVWSGLGVVVLRGTGRWR